MFCSIKAGISYKFRYSYFRIKSELQSKNVNVKAARVLEEEYLYSSSNP